MSVQQFENLVTVLNGAKDIYKFDEPLETSGLFDCEVCEKYFENCEIEDDSDACSKRFHDYANEKCEEQNCENEKYVIYYISKVP